MVLEGVADPGFHDRVYRWSVEMCEQAARIAAHDITVAAINVICEGTGCEPGE
jgi:hypothetical protein